MMKDKNKRQNIGLKFLSSGTWTLISLTCFLTSKTYGVLVHSLDDRKVIKAEVSRQGLTRITVKEDRILNVFGVTGEYVLETDEDQGQIFIRPMGPGSLNPISLTLTTEKGRTQDLLLTPGDKTPEALILEASESFDGTSTEKHSQSPPSRGEIEDLIAACQANRIPVGYKLMPLDLKTLHHPLRGSPLRGDSLREGSLREAQNLLIRAISNDHLRGLTYEVRNEEQHPLNITEEEFAQDPQTIAVFLSKRTLNPGERITVYVIAKAHP